MEEATFREALGVEGKLDFETYQKLAQRTSKGKPGLEKVENGLMGLNGEAGECIDILKKHKFQGHDMDYDHLKDELSDVLWYLAETAEGAGLSLSDIAEYNIEKLFKRFPDGFSADRSINR